MKRRLKIYSPPAAAIDWPAFNDCVLSTNWSRSIDLKNQFGFGQATSMAAWHGRPIGLIPFLRICAAMDIDPRKFLMER